MDAEQWHVSLDDDELTLGQALRGMESFKLKQEDVPLRIKLVENPKWFTSEFFSGAVDLAAHDCIHVLLGRGLLVKDEAFVIGYTMGSTKRVSRFKRNLFMFCSKYLYPKGYRFGEEERFVFNMGVALGSNCETDLSTAGNRFFKKIPLFSLRSSLRIDSELLRSYYEVEKKIFPKSPESQRLL